MKKTTIILAMLLASITVLANNDTIPKKDTAFVPVFERTDTIRANFTYLNSGSAVVYYAEQGYVIVRGFAGNRSGKPIKWLDPSKVQFISAMDEKKKPVHKIIQVF